MYTYQKFKEQESKNGSYFLKVLREKNDLLVQS